MFTITNLHANILQIIVIKKKKVIKCYFYTLFLL